MLWFIGAALCAYFIKGLCGFANTLIFSTILSFGVDNINISPVDLILGFPSNIIVTWKNRKELRWKTWLPLTILVIAGNIPGIFLLKNTDVKAIKVLFGIAVIAIGTEMLIREKNKKVHQNTEKTAIEKCFLVLIGIISGVLCGLYGIGALLAAYMSRVTRTNEEFKANICMVFIAENIFRIVMYTWNGILTIHVLYQAILLIPIMILGLWIGMKSSGKLNEAVVKKIVIIVLLLSGLSLIISNISI